MSLKAKTVEELVENKIKNIDENPKITEEKTKVEEENKITGDVLTADKIPKEIDINIDDGFRIVQQKINEDDSPKDKGKCGCETCMIW